MRLDNRATFIGNRFSATTLPVKQAKLPQFSGLNPYSDSQAQSSTAFYPAKPIPWAIFTFNQFFSGLICKPLGFKVQCHNPEKLASLKKQGQGVILAMNHSSLADKSTLLKLSAQTSLMPITMASLTAANNHLPIPLIWPFLNRLGIFSVNEGNPSVKNTKSFAQNILIKGEYPVCIFPEGKINWNSANPGPCQKGTMQIALNAANKSKKAMKVVPIGITYQYASKAEQQIWKTVRALESHILSRLKTEQNRSAFKKTLQNASLQEHLDHLLEWVICQSEFTHHLKPSGLSQTKRLEQLHHKIRSELKAEYGITITEPTGEMSRLYKSLYRQQCENKRPPLWSMLNPWSARRKEYKNKSQKIKNDLQTLNNLELLSSRMDALTLKPNLSNQLEEVCRLRCLILNKKPSLWNLMRHCTAHIVVGEPILVAPKPEPSTLAWENEILRLTSQLQTGLENTVRCARQQSQS